MNLIIKHLMIYLKQPAKTGSGAAAFLLFALLLSNGGGLLKAQNIKPSRQEAESAWMKGDYEKAYDNYNGLLLMYSRDPLYAYYTGACLVELNRDIPRSLTLLRSASHSSQNVRTIPDEIWFYYGRALQLSANYQEASKSFEKYKKVAGKKKAQEHNTQQYIDDCSRCVGGFTPSKDKDETAVNNGGREDKQRLFSSSADDNDFNRRMAYLQSYQFKSDSLLRIAEGIKRQIDKSPGEVKGLMRSRVVELETEAGRYSSSADSLKMLLGNDGLAKVADNGGNVAYITGNNDEEIAVEPVRTLSEDNVGKARQQDAAVPGEYDSQLTRAMKLQFTSDSLNRAAAGLRRQYETAGATEKPALKEKAVKLESEAMRCQSEADKILMKLEPGMPDPSDVEDLNTEKKPEEAVVEEKIEAKVETLVETKTVTETKEGVYSSFVLKGSPFYSDSEPIPVGPLEVKGLVYHIQLAAFRNPVSPSYFRNLYPVFGFLNSTNGVTYYYTGLFRTKDAAAMSLPAVRGNGFTDAFIVAFIDNTQVSMEKAAQAEGYWSGIPLFYKEKSSEEKEKSLNKAPVPSGTLVFRAEVLRAVKPVKPEVMDKIELLSGNRQLDIIKNNKGETIILIGKFITFESAEEYVSLLIRNGYNNAKVAAWVGNSEIPLESAKELMKKVEGNAPAN